MLLGLIFLVVATPPIENDVARITSALPNHDALQELEPLINRCVAASVAPESAFNPWVAVELEVRADARGLRRRAVRNVRTFNLGPKLGPCVHDALEGLTLPASKGILEAVGPVDFALRVEPGLTVVRRQDECWLSDLRRSACYARMAIARSDDGLCELTYGPDCLQYIDAYKRAQSSSITAEQCSGDLQRIDQRAACDRWLEQGDAGSCNDEQTCLEELARFHLRFDVCEGAPDKARCRDAAAAEVLYRALVAHDPQLCSKLDALDAGESSKVCAQIAPSKCVGLDERTCLSRHSCQAQYTRGRCTIYSVECSSYSFCRDPALPVELTARRWP